MILSPTLLILLLERSSAVVPLRPSKLAGPPSLANILKIVDNIFANPVVLITEVPSFGAEVSVEE